MPLGPNILGIGWICWDTQLLCTDTFMSGAQGGHSCGQELGACTQGESEGAGYFQAGEKRVWTRPRATWAGLEAVPWLNRVWNRDPQPRLHLKPTILWKMECRHLSLPFRRAFFWRLPSVLSWTPLRLQRKKPFFARTPSAELCSSHFVPERSNRRACLETPKSFGRISSCQATEWPYHTPPAAPELAGHISGRYCTEKCWLLSRIFKTSIIKCKYALLPCCFWFVSIKGNQRPCCFSSDVLLRSAHPEPWWRC